MKVVLRFRLFKEVGFNLIDILCILLINLVIIYLIFFVFFKSLVVFFWYFNNFNWIFILSIFWIILLCNFLEICFFLFFWVEIVLCIICCWCNFFCCLICDEIFWSVNVWIFLFWLINWYVVVNGIIFWFFVFINIWKFVVCICIDFKK